MSVERNLPIVRDRRQAALQGDAEQIKRQHDAGKLTARERVACLFDEASFVELDTLIADAGVITGYGLIDGHPVYAYAQDYTVKAGAVGAAQARKILKVLSLAEKTGAPVIALCDSHGARLDEGMNAVNAYASIMAKSADLSGVVPQIAVVLGPCGGGAAMCASMADIVIIGKNGQLFVNGPQLVSAVTGKRSGTITGSIPAAWAARIPLWESSTAIASSGATAKASQAVKKISGSGFECFTVSPPTTAAKYSAIPADASNRSTFSRLVEDATAIFAPASASAASVSLTPSFTGTPCSAIYRLYMAEARRSYSSNGKSFP